MAKQSNDKWEESGDVVVNPYNFVPLGLECRRKKERKNENLTGKIVCELIPKTDMFIPNTSNDNFFHTYGLDEEEIDRHKSYDFFSYTDVSKIEESKKTEVNEPVIPGSSIRGMIRNEYETLTNSCFGTNLDLELMRRQIKKVSAGILLGDGKTWYLYKAKRVSLSQEESEKLTTGDIVTYDIKIVKKREIACNIQKSNIPKSKFIQGDKNKHIGIALIGEGFDGGKKKFEHIFSLKNPNGGFIIPQSGTAINCAVKKLKNILDSYRKVNENCYNNYNIPDKPIKDTLIPVWYYKRTNGEEEYYYFSPAAIGKYYFHNTMENIISNHTKDLKSSNRNSFITCKQQEELCDACNLFGVVSNDGNSNFAVSGKVRFTDAALVNYDCSVNELYHAPIELKILASPSPCCVEMYTFLEEYKNIENIYWDFDWIDLRKKDAEEKYIGDRIRLNGRKFYWHHSQTLDYSSEEEENKNMKIKARVLKGYPENNGDKIKFQFEVYFEKISELDLKRLIWLLSLGGNENDLYHKLGMGKPYGLGSNKIKVCDVLLRKLKRENGTISYIPFESVYNRYASYFHKSEEKEKDKKIASELFNEKESMENLPNNNVLESFMKIMDFDSLKGKKIAYPTAISKNGETNIYEWFEANRNNGFKQILPQIMDADLRMHLYKET